MKTDPQPAEKFRAAMKQILAVSKEEILKRERDYKLARQTLKQNARPKRQRRTDQSPPRR